MIAHQVDKSLEYPPWRKRMVVLYDYERKMVRCDVKEGNEAGKSFIRRYDQKREYAIRGGEFAECRRSYLGEPLPLPELPTGGVEFVGTEDVNGVAAEHWLQDLGDERIHIYQTAAGARDGGGMLPIRLLDESVFDGKAEPLMTYDISYESLGPRADLSAGDFALPANYTHKACTMHVGGFPYIHAFHHFLRF